MAKNFQFFAENSVLLAGVVSCRAPYRILRVPNRLKCVWNNIGATYWVLPGRQHRKNQLSSKDGQKMPNFGRKQCIFGEQSGRRNPPLLLWGCLIKTNRFPLVLSGTKPIFMVFLCLYYTIQVHWCAAPFCSTTPEQTKILQNRPNSRGFDGFGECSGGRNPPILFLGHKSPKKRAISVENPL